MTNKKINFKRAAMFGLDARIALAIFGALSVISGAALYSAIQEAKVTRVIVEFQEFGKAIEQYMLDTGQNIPNETVNTYLADIVELHSSTVSGWKGPYFTQEGAAMYTTNLFVDSGWRGVDKQIAATAGIATDECTGGPGCYYMIRYAFAPKKIVDEIEKRLDSTVDANNGFVRYKLRSVAPHAGSYDLSIQGPPTL